MNKKISSLILVFIGLVIAILIANAQTAKPAYTLPIKSVAASLPAAGTRSGKEEVRGSGALTVLTANENDTITGSFVFSLTPEAIDRLAKETGRPAAELPASVTLKDVTAGFAHGSVCPNLRLEIRDLQLEYAGKTLTFRQVQIPVPESQEEMSRLFCTWARQVAVNRQRRGVVAAMNRQLSGEQ